MGEFRILLVIAIAILVVYVCYRIAEKKGFIPWFWLFTGGLGIILLLILPSANSQGLSEEVMKKRTGIANVIGICITVILVGGIFFLKSTSDK
ncbi:MAG: hypothetical protein Q8S54_19105 [Bacteroidota bacterium]|nr:hypothetical protein [Odoribacter sp.]MDP3645281.1 hypothetical protein [Bacteroidota bacterium]